MRMAMGMTGVQTGYLIVRGNVASNTGHEKRRYETAKCKAVK
jgi:hypothetical protein